MLHKLWRTLWMILNRDRIPHLPRGMLASHYEDVSGEERRVMARFGSRDFAGVRHAMKQHGVNTLDELVSKLEHQQPQRRFRHRLNLAIGRLVGGHPTDPHRAEIMIADRQRKSTDRMELEQRIKRVKKELKR